MAFQVSVWSIFIAKEPHVPVKFRDTSSIWGHHVLQIFGVKSLPVTHFIGSVLGIPRAGINQDTGWALQVEIASCVKYVE